MASSRREFSTVFTQSPDYLSPVSDSTALSSHVTRHFFLNVMVNVLFRPTRSVALYHPREIIICPGESAVFFTKLLIGYLFVRSK